MRQHELRLPPLPPVRTTVWEMEIVRIGLTDSKEFGVVAGCGKRVAEEIELGYHHGLMGLVVVGSPWGARAGAA